jgi:hypothetical protein
MLVDRHGVLKKQPNATVVLRADKARFRDMLCKVLVGA